MLTSLEQFVSHFAGYGNPQAKTWFVGMEEGGASSVPALRRRVTTWQDRGSKPLDDLVEYHDAIGERRHFQSPFPIQRTWAALLRFLAGMQGLPSDTESVRARQAIGFGRSGGGEALVELLPLPSPSTSSWPYATLAEEIPSLSSRGRYRRDLVEPRIRLLRRLVHAADAEVVLCYGITYHEHWRSLFKTDLVEQKLGETRYLRGRVGAQTCLVTPHPVAHGITGQFWVDLGETVADQP